MNIVEMNIEYCGATVDVKISTEDNYIGTLYPVELNGAYIFTLYTDEEERWGVLRENDGTVPAIEKELYDAVLKKLKWQLQYAA